MPLHSSSGMLGSYTWDSRRPIFAAGDTVLVNNRPETVASWEYTYTLASDSSAKRRMDKYRAYYEKESRKEHPNYTLMDMMLFLAACCPGVTATSVEYAMISAPSTYVAASEVSAAARLGDWVAFQVDASYYLGDLTRLVYSPRRFAAHTDYALPLSTSVRVHGLVTGTWSSPATRGGYLVTLGQSGAPDTMDMLKSVFGRADGSTFAVRVPFERIIQTGVAARLSISLTGNPARLGDFAAHPPLALTSAAVARTALKVKDFVCYRGAFCVVCDEGQPPKQSDTAAVWDAAEVELLTLVPESSSPSVSSERLTARYCNVIPVPAECADVPEYGYVLPPSPVGTRIMNGRITASRVTFTIGGKPPSQHAVIGYSFPFSFSDIAATAADEREKTGWVAAAPRYYGQLDSTLASIPTRDAKLACKVEYTTTMYLGDSEPMEVGQCVIHAGWLWVVTQVVPTTDGRVSYDLAEVEPSHLAGTSARQPRRVAASNVVPTAWRLSATALPSLARYREWHSAASTERYLLACGGASTYDASYTGQVPMNSLAERVAADRALLGLTRQNPAHVVTRAYVTDAAAIEPGACVIHQGRIWAVRESNGGGTFALREIVSVHDVPKSYDEAYSPASLPRVSYRQLIVLGASRGWSLEPAQSGIAFNEDFAWQRPEDGACSIGQLLRMQHAYDIDPPPLDRNTWNQAQSEARQAQWAYVRAAKDRLAESRKHVPNYTRFDSALLEVTLGNAGHVPLFYSLSRMRTLDESDTESPSALGASAASTVVTGVRAATLLTSIGLPQKLPPRDVGERITVLEDVGARIRAVRITRSSSGIESVYNATHSYGTVTAEYIDYLYPTWGEPVPTRGEAETRRTYRFGAVSLDRMPTYDGLGRTTLDLEPPKGGNVCAIGATRWQYIVEWDEGRDWPTLVDEQCELLDDPLPAFIAANVDGYKVLFAGAFRFEPSTRIEHPSGTMYDRNRALRGLRRW